MEVALHIPDDLAKLLGAAGEIERRVLETLALEEYKLGHLTKPQLRRVLRLQTGEALEGFLRAHNTGILDEAAREPAEPAKAEPTAAIREEARRAKARQAAADIIARRKGVTLGGLRIKDLINEGRR